MEEKYIKKQTNTTKGNSTKSRKSFLPLSLWRGGRGVRSQRQILFSFFLFCCTLAHSQTFTLSDCLNYAHAHRTELQKQQTADTYYRRNDRYTKYALLPSVSGKAGYQFNFDHQNAQTQSGNAELSGEWVVFNGFQTFNSVKQSNLLKERNRTQTEKIRNDIQLEITEVFFAVLLAQENIKISENAISSAEKQITVITQSVRAGRTSNIDLLEMQAQIEKERGNLITAKKQYELHLIRLKKAMNYTEKQEFTIIATAIDNSLSDNAENLRFLPAFQLAKQDSLFAVYDLRKVKGQYAPRLSLFGSLSSLYQKDNGSFKNQLDDNFTKIAGISLVIPLYSRHEIRKQQIEKERQLADILLDNKQLHNDIAFEIARIREEIAKTQEKIQSLEKRLDYYRQIHEMRGEQYRHGALSITDLLIAENNAKTAEMELVYEKYNWQYNLMLIEFYCEGR